MKVLIGMENLLFSEALCMALNCDGIEYQAQSCQHHALTESFMPDVVVVDHVFLQDTSHQSWHDAKVLLIDTGLQEEKINYFMHIHKLYGVLSLSAGLQQLKKAIAVIHAGQIWLDNERLKVILHGGEKVNPGTTVEKLSHKESQIVKLVVEGFKNREIAARLLLSEQTIKSHLGRIFRKMQVKNRSQLVSTIFKNRPPLEERQYDFLFAE
ncbi:MAG: response regulator transcription factor [Deltaproteobacteria bacterium]|nr:response regulator transcription factor [Deltaproteobacteria bacterium]